MKNRVGLDIGTNSVGWSLIGYNAQNNTGKILGLGSRIIPMSQEILGKFDAGVTDSNTAERTSYRGVRRLRQRVLLRRERLHRVLNIIDFLPEHYKQSLDFEKKLGQFKNNKEVKLNYRLNKNGKHEFVFMDAFNEMANEFKANGIKENIPLDWTIYYLRQKALKAPITKQELAWVLLNFNQKRGYYQLRGEEEADDKGKDIKFEILYVSDVKNSGEVLKKTGEPLYDIYFSNGWTYDRQTTKPENWLHKHKEFIVTTSTLKNGELKRSYKAVDSEKDWIAIKKKTEQDIKATKQTVGQYIYNTLLTKPNQKIRGKLVKTIERHFYKEELKVILDTQLKYHEALQDKALYAACVNELYPKNKAHQNNIVQKDFSYLFLDDIIFYQRPLKSKKSTIANCPYETRTYIKNGKKETQYLKCIPKSHPLFIEFRLWQFIKNLKIHDLENTDKDVTTSFFTTEDDLVALFDFLDTKATVEQKHVLDFLVQQKKIAKNDKSNYRWNYVQDKKYPANELKASFVSRLKKIKTLKVDDFLTNTIVFNLWHIIYSVKDKNQYKQALKTFANKHQLDETIFVEAFKKYPPFKNDYGAYSEKAIKKLLPLMRQGKYWDETAIDEVVKARIDDIITRLESISFDENVFKKDEHKLLETIIDDAVPKQFLKSFLPYKNANPYKGLNTYQACYAVYEKHSESGIINIWKTPSDIDKYLHNFKQHSLRNPIVEQVVTETLRVVKDIWIHYGNGTEDFFDQIHVELGREMKNSSDKRKALSKRNSENENTNTRIKALLQELKADSNFDIRPYSPSHQELLKLYEEGVYQNPNVNFKDVEETEIEKIRKSNAPTKAEILKYKLWLQQGYISPYTGKLIPLSDLFSLDYEIEHIIPQSRYFDNSMSNKIICESEVNNLKSNKTAVEFLKQEGGRVVTLSKGKTATLLNISQYENHCTQYFKKHRTKLKNLLSEDIPEGFINRQLNDSRYISKIVKTLLSNIVRQDGEKEVTAKKLVPVTGAITAKLKQDWGLNDKWNALVAPRFKRLNALTDSNDFGYWDDSINAFRCMVPDDLSKGFSKKRIDHRHHALDALVVACCTKNHINYLTSLNTQRENYGLKERLLIKNKQGDFTKHFKQPWPNFAADALQSLETTVVSFKQNLRVINKTNNKTWQWQPQPNGTFKKVLVKQKGPANSNNKTNWAIRKPLHKETVSGAVIIKRIKKNRVKLLSYLETPNLIVDKKIKAKVNTVLQVFNNDAKKAKAHLKSTPITSKGKVVDAIQVYEYTQKATATRVTLNDSFTAKNLNAVTDSGIRNILKKHVNNYLNPKGEPNFKLAFSAEGIEALNKNIVALNNNKFHHPIYKVRLYEEGSKFKVGETGAKNTKYVEAAKGTNLFFAVYNNANKGKRVFETIPLDEVIAHQKQTAHLPKQERLPIQPKASKGEFLFTLSPNDLVYVPSPEEQINMSLVDFNNLTKTQVNNIYKVVSFTGNQCFFILNNVSKPIFNKKEFSALNKMEKAIEGYMIKNICFKINSNRLGKIKL